MVYDLIIIGGGPAGTAASVYAARKKIKTLVITESFGGQSEVSADIQNWIGTKSISGYELAQAFEAHTRTQEDLAIASGERVHRVTKSSNDTFLVETSSSTSYESRALIVASGARRRRLDVPGEEELAGRGVAYCATCDAPLFKGKRVAVVGGGNAGLESAVDLLPYASKIYLLEYSAALKGDPITQKKVRDAGVDIILQARTTRIIPDEDNKFVAGLVYEDQASRSTRTLDVEGVFVEIGSLPNSDIMGDLVKLNTAKEIIIDHRTAATSQRGIWAAGDVTDELYKQNNISAGDGVKAALSAYMYLENMENIKA